MVMSGGAGLWNAVEYGIALVTAAVGWVLAWRVIRHERRPSACDDALLCWDEEPLPAWWQSRATAALIALHSSSVLILGILFLLDTIAHHGSRTLFLLDATPYLSVAERSQISGDIDSIAAGG